MIKKYTKKPIEIEAYQFDGSIESADFIIEWIKNSKTSARKMNMLIKKDLHSDENITFDMIFLLIETLEGDHEVSKYDFVIKGIEGEFYSCKPSIFNKTYNEVIEHCPISEIKLIFK